MTSQIRITLTVRAWGGEEEDKKNEGKSCHPDLPVLYG